MKNFLFLLFESLSEPKDLKYEKTQKFRSQILNVCLILRTVTLFQSHKIPCDPVKLGWISTLGSSSESIPVWIDNILSVLLSARLSSKLLMFQDLLSGQSKHSKFKYKFSQWLEEPYYLPIPLNEIPFLIFINNFIVAHT